MKATVLAIALVFSIAQHTVLAHTSHGVDEATAITIVYEAVPQMTEENLGFDVGQLEKSWNSIAESDLSMVETDGNFYVMQATDAETIATIFFLIGINGKVLEVKNSNDF